MPDAVALPVDNSPAALQAQLANATYNARNALYSAASASALAQIKATNPSIYLQAMVAAGAADAQAEAAKQAAAFSPLQGINPASLAGMSQSQITGKYGSGVSNAVSDYYRQNPSSLFQSIVGQYGTEHNAIVGSSGTLTPAQQVTFQPYNTPATQAMLGQQAKVPGASLELPTIPIVTGTAVPTASIDSSDTYLNATRAAIQNTPLLSFIYGVGESFGANGRAAALSETARATPGLSFFYGGGTVFEARQNAGYKAQQASDLYNQYDSQGLITHEQTGTIPIEQFNQDIATYNSNKTIGGYNNLVSEQSQILIPKGTFTGSVDQLSKLQGANTAANLARADDVRIETPIFGTQVTPWTMPLASWAFGASQAITDASKTITGGIDSVIPVAAPVTHFVTGVGGGIVSLVPFVALALPAVEWGVRNPGAMAFGVAPGVASQASGMITQAKEDPALFAGNMVGMIVGGKVAGAAYERIPIGTINMKLSTGEVIYPNAEDVWVRGKLSGSPVIQGFIDRFNLIKEFKDYTTVRGVWIGGSAKEPGFVTGVAHGPMTPPEVFVGKETITNLGGRGIQVPARGLYNILSETYIESDAGFAVGKAAPKPIDAALMNEFFARTATDDFTRSLIELKGTLSESEQLKLTPATLAGLPDQSGMSFDTRLGVMRAFQNAGPDAIIVGSTAIQVIAGPEHTRNPLGINRDVDSSVTLKAMPSLQRELAQVFANTGISPARNTIADATLAVMEPGVVSGEINWAILAKYMAPDGTYRIPTGFSAHSIPGSTRLTPQEIAATELLVRNTGAPGLYELVDYENKLSRMSEKLDIMPARPLGTFQHALLTPESQRAGFKVMSEFGNDLQLIGSFPQPDWWLPEHFPTGIEYSDWDIDAKRKIMMSLSERMAAGISSGLAPPNLNILPKGMIVDPDLILGMSPTGQNIGFGGYPKNGVVPLQAPTPKAFHIAQVGVELDEGRIIGTQDMEITFGVRTKMYPGIEGMIRSQEPGSYALSQMSRSFGESKKGAEMGWWEYDPSTGKSRLVTVSPKAEKDITRIHNTFKGMSVASLELGDLTVAARYARLAGVMADIGADYKIDVATGVAADIFSGKDIPSVTPDMEQKLTLDQSLSAAANKPVGKSLEPLTRGFSFAPRGEEHVLGAQQLEGHPELRYAMVPSIAGGSVAMQTLQNAIATKLSRLSGSAKYVYSPANTIDIRTGERIPAGTRVVDGLGGSKPDTDLIDIVTGLGKIAKDAREQGYLELADKATATKVAFTSKLKTEFGIDIKDYVQEPLMIRTTPNEVGDVRKITDVTDHLSTKNEISVITDSKFNVLSITEGNATGLTESALRENYRVAKERGITDVYTFHSHPTELYAGLENPHMSVQDVIAFPEISAMAKSEYGINVLGEGVISGSRGRLYEFKSQLPSEAVPRYRYLIDKNYSIPEDYIGTNGVEHYKADIASMDVATRQLSSEFGFGIQDLSISVERLRGSNSYRLMGEHPMLNSIIPAGTRLSLEPIAYSEADTMLANAMGFPKPGSIRSFSPGTKPTAEQIDYYSNLYGRAPSSIYTFAEPVALENANKYALAKTYAGPLVGVGERALKVQISDEDYLSPPSPAKASFYGIFGLFPANQLRNYPATPGYQPTKSLEKYPSATTPILGGDYPKGYGTYDAGSDYGVYTGGGYPPAIVPPDYPTVIPPWIPDYPTTKTPPNYPQTRTPPDYPPWYPPWIPGYPPATPPPNYPPTTPPPDQPPWTPGTPFPPITPPGTPTHPRKKKPKPKSSIIFREILPIITPIEEVGGFKSGKAFYRAIGNQQILEVKPQQRDWLHYVDVDEDVRELQQKEVQGKVSDMAGMNFFRTATKQEKAKTGKPIITYTPTQQEVNMAKMVGFGTNSKPKKGRKSLWF